MKHAVAIPLLASLALAGCNSGDPRAEATATAAAVADAPSVAPTMPTTVADPAATAALRTFAGRDTNGDGFVSSAENAAAADKIFDAIDGDQDGTVSAQELTAARIALGLDKLPGSNELIARADQDGDGQLTLAEWIAAESVSFRDADENADGKLSPKEWNRFYRFLGSKPAEAERQENPDE
jgi:Ca2+-binding EF-hand superfamily protein